MDKTATSTKTRTTKGQIMTRISTKQAAIDYARGWGDWFSNSLDAGRAGDELDAAIERATEIMAEAIYRNEDTAELGDSFDGEAYANAAYESVVAEHGSPQSVTVDQREFRDLLELYGHNEWTLLAVNGPLCWRPDADDDHPWWATTDARRAFADLRGQHAAS